MTRYDKYNLYDWPITTNYKLPAASRRPLCNHQKRIMADKNWQTWNRHHNHHVSPVAAAGNMCCKSFSNSLQHKKIWTLFKPVFKHIQTTRSSFQDKNKQNQTRPNTAKLLHTVGPRETSDVNSMDAGAWPPHWHGMTGIEPMGSQCLTYWDHIGMIESGIIWHRGSIGIEVAVSPHHLGVTTQWFSC